MKRKIIYIPGLMILAAIGACESLDLQVRTTLTENQVGQSYERVKGLNAACYSVLTSGFSHVGGAMLASASDEAEHSIETSGVHKFNTGAWNPVDNPNDVWYKYYRGIRQANDLLRLADSVDLDLWRLDPSTTAQNTYLTRKADIQNWKYEGRFLRAYFYFELVKRYGGVPIITEMLDLETDYTTITRQSLDSCINFIVAECDSAAAKLLPKPLLTSDYGRATKGAALSLKARVLLYAASDLFNDPSWASGYTHPELISLTGNRTARWQAAANAAQAAFSTTGAGYALLNNYATLFGGGLDNTEIILARREGSSNSFEKSNYPIGFDKATGGTTPSQNIVDLYEVKVDATTAVPFDWNNPDHAANPFNPAGTLGRDPRLAMTVVWNGANFTGNLITRAVESWPGGKDGPGIPNATRTGYYLKKYVANLDLITEKTSVHNWLLIRVAEMYLSYAEALNEADPGNANILTYLNFVRTRATVTMPAIPSGLSQEAMRDIIRHERTVELAFEEHRFWDVRRWKIAESTLNVPLRGLSITGTAAPFTYAPVDVESRTFVPKMYLYPIPQTELIICTGLVQNPLW
jgi:hypothetical protein